jgi:hypothetical protein
MPTETSSISRSATTLLVLLACWVLGRPLLVFVVAAFSGMNEPRQIARHVAEGDILVQAIYNYKLRTGLWPETISASECPTGAGPTCHWHYQWLGYDWPPILSISPAMHCAATYRFPGRESAPIGGETPGWSISGDSRSSTIVSSSASWQPTDESADDIAIRKIAELRR